MEQSKITRDAIIEEAIALLSEDGLDGVTLRKLADRLGIKAPSLYWHFRDKSALLAAVMAQTFDACLDAVPPQADWREWMRAFGLTLWRTQTSIRDLGRIITTTELDASHLRNTQKRIRSRLVGLNIAEEDAFRIQSAVQALVTGWSAFSHAPYARHLSKAVAFDQAVASDLDALIEGKALQLERSGKRRKRRS